MIYIFPGTTNPYNLRNNNPFQSSNVHTVYHETETLPFRGPKTWALVLKEIKASKSITDFKLKNKQWEPLGCTCMLYKEYVNNIGFIQ